MITDKDIVELYDIDTLHLSMEDVGEVLANIAITVSNSKPIVSAEYHTAQSQVILNILERLKNRSNAYSSMD